VSEAGGEPVRGIGARLRSAREKKGLTVLQAAEKLHVDARLLESFEVGQFSALGAAVYVRGHLRRYADLIGESPAELQQLYDETTHTAQPDLTRISRNEPGADASRLMVPALLILVGFALAGILWWLLTMERAKSSAARAAQPVVAAGAAASPLAAAGGAASNSAPSAGEPLPTAGALQPPPAAAPADTAQPVPTAGHAQLALKFTAASWVEVYDARGRRLLHGVEAADSARTLKGAAPLRVVLGNAPGVALQLNGQAVPLEGLVHHDGSAHIVIDRTGRASAAHTGVPRG
jgi:cytoskeleton protein RodZ